jgi:hypothetical protein
MSVVLPDPPWPTTTTVRICVDSYVLPPDIEDLLIGPNELTTRGLAT